MTHLYPLARQTWANPIPVLPAVPSTTVPPGFILNINVTMQPVNHNDLGYSPTLLLCITNDTKRSSIFHTTTWILELGFAVDMCPSPLR